MKAYKCDRCGKLFEKYKYQGTSEFFSITRNPNFSSDCLDLCPKCNAELQEWVANDKEQEDLLPQESENKMTYGDIAKQFYDKFPDVEVDDWRPADPMFIPQLLRPIPNAILVWLKDGSKVIYIAENEAESEQVGNSDRLKGE